MTKVAVNQEQVTETSIVSCNIRSLLKNYENFATASATQNAYVMCLQETWLDPLAPQTNLLEKEGWYQHDNSVGKGKGITTFYKKEFDWERDVTNPNYQITKIKSESQDIINVYKSSGATTELFVKDLCEIVSTGKVTIILGDFNTCYNSSIEG